MLQLMMDDEKVDVVIPTEEQVDEETYKSFVNLLTQELVNLLQVPHYTPEIRDALNNSGLVAEFQGVTLMMNPLKASTGEQDQF